MSRNRKKQTVVREYMNKHNVSYQKALQAVEAAARQSQNIETVKVSSTETNKQNVEVKEPVAVLQKAEGDYDAMVAATSYIYSFEEFAEKEIQDYVTAIHYFSNDLLGNSASLEMNDDDEGYSIEYFVADMKELCVSFIDFVGSDKMKDFRENESLKTFIEKALKEAQDTIVRVEERKAISEAKEKVFVKRRETLQKLIREQGFCDEWNLSNLFDILSLEEEDELFVVKEKAHVERYLPICEESGDTIFLMPEKTVEDAVETMEELSEGEVPYHPVEIYDLDENKSIPVRININLKLDN